LQDADTFFRLNGDAEVMKYIRKAKTKEESDLFLQENLALYQRQKGIGRFAVFTKDNHLFIGSFAILPLNGTDDFHIGYALLQPFHGKGYATELVKASLGVVFDIIRQNRVLAITVNENLPSQKVLLKCGFVQTGTTVHEGSEVMIFEKNRWTV
jgi:ribosomal-protein-alanine N-acetyltransferase